MNNYQKKVEQIPKESRETKISKEADQAEKSGKDALKFDDLKFIEVREPDTFQHIPRYLFEQIKGRNWEVERIYEFGPFFIQNLSNRLWVLSDAGNVIKAVLWAVIDSLSEKLSVIVFSVDEEYQNPSNFKSVLDFLRQFIKDFNELECEIKLKEKINWLTTQPEAFENQGWKRCEIVSMEYGE